MTDYPRSCAGLVFGQLCPRTIQPRRWPKTEGVWTHAGKGMCGRCLSAHERGTDTTPKRTRITPGQQCADCHTPLRPGGSNIADWPGTVDHVGNSRCSPCFQHAYRATKPKPPPKTKTKHLVVDPNAPRVPKGWYTVSKTPQGRPPKKSSGQSQIMRPPTDPPEVTAAARATVMRHGGDPLILKMLGLDA